MLKTIYDIMTSFLRMPTFSWSILYQPLLSTSAVLLLLTGLQLMLIGMVADGVLRRISQHNRPMVPSNAILIPGSGFSQQAEGEERNLNVKN